MNAALGILLLATFTTFKEKQRYTFKYNAEIIHSIPGGANQQIGLRLQCTCHVTIVKRIEPAEAQIKLENVQLHQLRIDHPNQENSSPLQADPEAIKMLEKNPVELIFSRSGRVKTLRVDKQEPEWCLNIKRGIANMLQIAPKAENLDPKQILTSKTPVVVQQKEQTLVGNCPVTYTVEPWVQQDVKTQKLVQVTKVTKTVEYKKCVDRPHLRESIVLGQLCPSCQQKGFGNEFKNTPIESFSSVCEIGISLGYVPYLRHAGQIEHILDNRFLKQAKAEEYHTFTPYSELGGKVEACVRQNLVFQSEQEKPSIDVLKNAIQTTLKMKIVHPEQEMRQQFKKGILNKVMQLQQQLASEVNKDLSSQAIPRIVSELTVHLRMCDYDSWKHFLTATLQHQNQQVRNLCADAMGLAATKESVQLMNDVMIKDKKMSTVLLPLFDRILTNIVFTTEVTADHVDAVLNLCERAPDFQPKERLSLRRQCYISYGALVNRLNQRPDAQQRTDIQTSIKTCVEHLQNKLDQAGNDDDEKLCFIKAIGNAGQAEHQASILKHLQGAHETMAVRVESVWALRRMVHSEQRDKLTSKLIEIFHDRKQDPELRMAIVELMLDRQPSFINMQTFLNAVIREKNSQGPRSNQVASFVISKLSSMAYYNNFMLKERASRARRCLSSARRSVSKMDFGIQFSKAMRFATYSNKLLGGLELETNKMNVPQSYIPRNMNARLLMHVMGNHFEVIQGGARMEGLQDIVQDLVSEIRSRQRRSIWSSVWEFFSNQEKKSSTEATNPSTQAASQPSSGDEQDEFQETAQSKSSTQRPTTSRTTSRAEARSTEQSTQQSTQSRSQRPTNSFEDKENPKKPELSLFMKVFGQEIKFLRITPEIINQLAGQINDLLLGKITEIQTALGAIKITKNSVTVSQSVTKAFLAAHARQLEPTICGLPLHHHVMSTVLAQIEARISAEVEPSLWKLLSAKDFKLSVDVRPKVSVLTNSMIQIHSPFVRVGLKSQNVIQMRPSMGFLIDSKLGSSYNFKIQVPKRQTDVFVVSPDPAKEDAVGVCGNVETLNVKEFKVNQHEVQLQLSKQYMTEFQEQCYGEETLGIATCIKAKVPSPSTLRFSDVPVFPFFAQTNLRMRIVPKDNIKNIEIQVNINKQKKTQGVLIFRANGRAKREMTVHYEYNSQENRLFFKAKKLSLEITCPSLRKITAVLRKQNKYKWTVHSDIDDTGRLLNLKFEWNKLPQSLKNTLRKYEPQILYWLQSFALLSSQDRPTKSIQIVLHLLSPLASRLFVESPMAKAQSKIMSLPVSMRRLPLSFNEILGWPYSE
ncbi:Vitellogenin-1 [Exaiptasia diaphana]|nr:Vitellogenin-1 [Exaiptasia diaphana]